MKENTNGQAVQGKPADQTTKGNDGTLVNPKNVVMTPEKIKEPIESKENEQIRDVKKQPENKDSQGSKAPVAEQVKTPVENKTNKQVEKAEIAEDEEQDDDELSADDETPVTERKQGMPISFDH